MNQWDEYLDALHDCLVSDVLEVELPEDFIWDLEYEAKRLGITLDKLVYRKLIGPQGDL